MTVYLRAGGAAWIAGLVLLSCASAARAAEPQWDRSAARTYLDGRTQQWLAWSEAKEAGGGGTRCISCHTAVPMAMARPLLGESSSAADSMLQNIRTRVAGWDRIAAWNGQPDQMRPFYNGRAAGSRKSDALATESVLNALVLTHSDASSARQALEIMWSTQNAAGAWDWLTFDLRPWELDAEYLGAAWAAIAVGRAGPAYHDTLSDGNRAKLDKLRAYLQDRYAHESLHNRLAGLWAATRLPGILTDAQRQALIEEVLLLDKDGDAWSLTSLAKKANDTATWRQVHAIPDDATFDGYATAYVLHVLKQAKADPRHPKVVRATSWLIANKIVEGQGPAIYLNSKRHPASDDPEQALVGKFMHDAAAAYAVMALSPAE